MPTHRDDAISPASWPFSRRAQAHNATTTARVIIMCTLCPDDIYFYDVIRKFRRKTVFPKSITCRPARKNANATAVPTVIIDRQIWCIFTTARLPVTSKRDGHLLCVTIVFLFFYFWFAACIVVQNRNDKAVKLLHKKKTYTHN